MDYNKYKNGIKEAIAKYPNDPQPYVDMIALLKNMMKNGWVKVAIKWNEAFRPLLDQNLFRATNEGKMELANILYKAKYESLLISAPHVFDSYLQCVEYHKPLNKQFYQPRKVYLKRYVDAYQKVLDGELDFLSISMPKRAGKSQLGINFTCMLSGKSPDKSTLMEGTGDDLVNSFYDGVLEYIREPNEYNYHDIFPEAQIVETDAKLKTMNLKMVKRFPTVMCRSIDASQVGLSEATNLLYLDDCVAGLKESRNREILDEKWRKLSGDVIGRAIEGTPIVICGTRYSLYDPIGHLQEEMKNQGKRMLVLETPALNLETDESNFEYVREGKKVFTTKYFRDQRKMLTDEQFESEFQQMPFEAKGLLFPKDKLKYYYKLPVDIEPDAIVAVCDTAESGSDSTSMPVACLYGNEVYIIDVIFDDSAPNVTIPEVASSLMKNKVSTAMFESNNAGSYFAKDVSKLIDSNNGICDIRTKRTVSNKQTRIELASPNIINHFYFLHPSCYETGSQYESFMKQVTTYTRQGKVVHDDAPDSLSLLENFIRQLDGGQVEVIKRPF